MRKLAVALTLGSALGLSGPAWAADIIDECNGGWDGVYAGVFGGVGFSSSDWDGSDGDIQEFEAPVDETLNDTAFLLGGLVGVNFQHCDWVFGAEGDIAWLHSRERENLDGAEGLDITSKIDFLGSVRARVGYAPGRTLYYLTGGLAFSDAKHTWDDHGSVDFDLSPESVKLDFGWVIGAGIEHAWTDNLLVRIEGLYFDLGSEDGEVDNEEETDTFEVDQDIFVGRIGISYKLN
ncbi:MAG: outer membrane protein [Parvibaculaceae bacterium]